MQWDRKGVDVQNCYMTDTEDSNEAQEKARKRLELALQVTGWSAAKLASEAGLAASTISRFLNFPVKHTISLKTLAKVDDAVWRYIKSVPDPRESIRLTFLYGASTPQVEPLDTKSISIQVRGAVQAGHWAEAIEWPRDEWDVVRVPRPDGHKSYFGLLVKGPSMNQVYPEDTILVCVPMMHYDHALSEEDHVIVQRRAESGLVEATVKEIRSDSEGRIWLWPKSTHPEYQSPIELPRPDASIPDAAGADDVRIVAVVVADYRVRKPTPKRAIPGL